MSDSLKNAFARQAFSDFNNQDYSLITPGVMEDFSNQLLDYMDKGIDDILETNSFQVINGFFVLSCKQVDKLFQAIEDFVPPVEPAP